MNNLNWLDGLPDKNPEIVKSSLSVPQLPRLPSEKSGRLEANNGGLPRLPRPAPTENNEYRAEKVPAAPLEGAGSELKSAAETDHGEVWAAGFLACWKLLYDCGLLVRPAQPSGHECHGCQHMAMTFEHWPGTRRKFFIRCELGHQQMEIGYAGQRVTIAPLGCDHWNPHG